MDLESFLPSLYTLVDDRRRVVHSPAARKPSPTAAFGRRGPDARGTLSMATLQERAILLAPRRRAPPWALPKPPLAKPVNRHVRALEPELRALQRDLSRELADDSEVYRVLDTTLVPAIVRAKARRKGLFAGKAAVGRSVSKTEWIYGFKVWPSCGRGEREMREEHRVTTKCMSHIYPFVNFPFRGAAGR